MAKTFLQAINDSLKAAAVIEGSTGELTSFSVSAIQVEIDIMIQSWNQTLREAVRASTLTGETAEGTLTLVTGQSSYDFSSDMSVTDFEVMVGNPVDATNEEILLPYPFKTHDGKEGWLAMRELIPDRSDQVGLPRYWTQNTNDNLEIDTEPTSNENGRAYVFVYEKRINLTAITDTFPFSDSVIEQMIPAVVEVYNLKRKDKFQAGIFNTSLAGAMQLARSKPPSTKYGVS